ncbi:MAG: NUDIX domain-containing protein [Candidatus Paceibacterota bacterium]|jgi:isopentenyldiphosphate isomerase
MKKDIIEYLDIYDEHGYPTGEVETYDYVHFHGLLHKTVHVWIINSAGQILLQKRVKTMKAFPSLYDISASGHISSGDTSRQAANGETKTEVGLDLPTSAFIFLGMIRQSIRKHDGGKFIDNEWNDIYVAFAPDDYSIPPIESLDGEVEELRWISQSEFKEWIKENGEILVPHDEEYQMLLKYLENQR